MKSKTKLEAPKEGGNIEEIFADLREIDVKVEGRGRKLEYEGKQLEFTITEDEVDYKLPNGVSMEEDLAALTYLQTEIKKEHGYEQSYASLQEADPEIDIEYDSGEA